MKHLEQTAKLRALWQLREELGLGFSLGHRLLMIDVKAS